jgi:hypothetical protein
LVQFPAEAALDLAGPIAAAGPFFFARGTAGLRQEFPFCYQNKFKSSWPAAAGKRRGGRRFYPGFGNDGSEGDMMKEKKERPLFKEVLTKEDGRYLILYRSGQDEEGADEGKSQDRGQGC